MGADFSSPPEINFNLLKTQNGLDVDHLPPVISLLRVFFSNKYMNVDQFITRSVSRARGIE